jgi:hypothetical protein
MISANWLRAGGVGLIVALLAPACDDNSPLGPSAIPVGDPPAPLLAVTPPGADDLDDPSAPASDYCTDTRNIGGDCTFTNNTGTGYFLQLDLNEPSGTGVFNPFVRLNANTAEEQGVNSSGRDLPWDENTSPQYTRDLRLDQVPTLECPAGSPWPGGTCREFALDANEEGAEGKLDIYLSLDAVRIYISPNADICDADAGCKNHDNPFTFDPFALDFGLTDGELIWALDGIKHQANAVGLDYSNDNGSGRADLALYILNSAFGDAGEQCNYDQGMGDDCDYYVHLYSYFGVMDIQGDGFEEWDVRVLPIVQVEKTANVVADRRWNWTVEKTPDTSYDLFDGDQIVQQYDIVVDQVDFDYVDYRVDGTITITNPDKKDPVLITSITDFLGANEATATLICEDFDPADDGTVDPPYELAKNSSTQCSYGPIAVGDDFTTTTNTATVMLESGGAFEGHADADPANVQPDDDIDESVTLTDNVNEALSEQFTDDGATSYQWTWTCDADEGDNVNTATITGDDSQEALDSDDATLTLNCYDLAVTKDANTSFTRAFDWTIDKEADQTSIGPLSSGQSFLVNYSVTVDLATPPYVDSDWSVSGTITIQNNNPSLAADLTNVADVVSPDIIADVDCGGATSVPADGSIDCTYSATLPNGSDRTNTATATMQNREYYWDGSTPTNIGTTDYSNSPAEDVTFGEPTDLVDECIDVFDTFPEFALANPGASACYNDVLPKTFSYTKTFSADSYPDCATTDVDNTASYLATDGESGSDMWTVTVLRDCPTCTLTQGYWKTHNDDFWGGAPDDPTWYDLLPGLGASAVFFPATGNTFTYFDAMWTAPAGNAYWILARQWIAAKLNYQAGSSGGLEVDQALAFGEALFSSYTPAEVATWTNETGRHDVIMAAAALATFNEGVSGPGHCDDDEVFTVHDDVPIL